MDTNRGKFIQYPKLNSKGQSSVEYILLFAVVVSITYTIFNGLGFNRIFGPNGTIATTYRNQLEFSYRHGFVKKGAPTEPDYKAGVHESYNGRLFSAVDPYP
jgi:hypothetical protein